MAKDKNKDKDLELRFLEEMGDTEGFSSDVSSLTSQINKNRKKERMEHDVLKSISSIAKQQEQTQRLIQQRELGYTKGIVEIERSSNKLLQKLGLTVDTMTRSARKILVTTAQTTKDVITDMGKALNEEFRVNKANTVGMALAATTPIFGYFAAKFMETSVFQDFKEKIKDKLGEVFTFVGDKFKKAFGQMRGKKFSELVDMAGRGLVEFLKLPFKLIGASFRGLWEGTKFLLKLPFKAIGLAFAGIMKLTKFILTLPFKTIGLAFKAILLPFKIIKGMFGAIRSGFRLDFGQKGGKRAETIPSLQKGGYVKKSGNVNVHAGEVISPVSLVFKEMGKHLKKAFESKSITSISEEIVKLRVSLTGVENEFTTALMERFTKGPIAKKLLKIYNVIEGISGVIHFFTRPRGKYTRQLPRGSSPMQNMQTIMGMLYANGMAKLDQIIKILGGNPEDDSTRAGSYIDDGIGLWGLLKKKKKEIFGGDGSGLLSSGLFKSAVATKKVQEGMFSFFGNSFYKSWKKQNKIENEGREESEESLKDIQESSERMRENSDNNEKRAKKASSWIGRIALFALGAVKNLAIGGFKALGKAIMAIASGIGILTRGGGLAFITQGLSKGLPLLGKFVGLLRQYIGFSLKFFGWTVASVMPLIDLVRGSTTKARDILSKRKDEKISGGERLLAGGVAAASSATGGVAGAKWGAMKWGLRGGLPGMIIGTILGSIGAKNLIGLSKALITDVKFGARVTYDALAKPLVDAVSGTISMMKENTIEWLSTKKDQFMGWVGDLIGPVVDYWKDKAKSWLDENPKVKMAMDSVSEATSNLYNKLSGFMQKAGMFLSSLWEAIHPSNIWKTIKGAGAAAAEHMGQEVDWADVQRLQAEREKKYKESRDQTRADYWNKANVAKREANKQERIDNSNLITFDNGGFVGGDSTHKNIKAHRDEYVVDPALSRAIKERAKLTGVNPKDLIKSGLEGNITTTVIKKMEEGVSESTENGFKTLLNGLIKYDKEKKVEQQMGFGGSVSNFVGGVASSAYQGAKNVATSAYQGLTSFGGKVGTTLFDLKEKFTKSGLSGIIEKASNVYGVDKSLISAVIQAESGGNPRATSPVGAQGLMQLMPDTARGLGVFDPYDPEQNVMGGTKYLAWLLKKYGGDKAKALAAYNWGTGNIDRKGMGTLPRETQNYISKITGILNTPETKPMEVASNTNVKGKDIAKQYANSTKMKNDILVSALTDGMKGSNDELNKNLKDASNQTAKNTQVLNVVTNNMSSMNSSPNINNGQSFDPLQAALLNGSFPA